jgi:hypothetical protein
LIGWGGDKTGDVRMTVEETGDCAAQGARAMPVNDSHLTQTRKRRLVEKLVNCIDCFISRLPNHVQL